MIDSQPPFDLPFNGATGPQIPSGSTAYTDIVFVPYPQKNGKGRSGTELERIFWGRLWELKAVLNSDGTINERKRKQLGLNI